MVGGEVGLSGTCGAIGGVAASGVTVSGVGLTGCAVAAGGVVITGAGAWTEPE